MFLIIDPLEIESNLFFRQSVDIHWRILRVWLEVRAQLALTGCEWTDVEAWCVFSNRCVCWCVCAFACAGLQAEISSSSCLSSSSICSFITLFLSLVFWESSERDKGMTHQPTVSHVYTHSLSHILCTHTHTHTASWFKYHSNSHKRHSSSFEVER